MCNRGLMEGGDRVQAAFIGNRPLTLSVISAHPVRRPGQESRDVPRPPHPRDHVQVRNPSLNCDSALACAALLPGTEGVLMVLLVLAGEEHACVSLRYWFV